MPIEIGVVVFIWEQTLCTVFSCLEKDWYVLSSSSMWCKLPYLHMSKFCWDKKWIVFLSYLCTLISEPCKLHGVGCKFPLYLVSYYLPKFYPQTASFQVFWFFLLICILDMHYSNHPFVDSIYFILFFYYWSLLLPQRFLGHLYYHICCMYLDLYTNFVC